MKKQLMVISGLIIISFIGFIMVLSTVEPQRLAIETDYAGFHPPSSFQDQLELNKTLDKIKHILDPAQENAGRSSGHESYHHEQSAPDTDSDSIGKRTIDDRLTEHEWQLLQNFTEKTLQNGTYSEILLDHEHLYVLHTSLKGQSRVRFFITSFLFSSSELEDFYNSFYIPPNIQIVSPNDQVIIYGAQISLYPSGEIAFEYEAEERELVLTDGSLNIHNISFDITADSLKTNHSDGNTIEWVGARLDLKANRVDPYDIGSDFKDNIQIVDPSHEPLQLYDSTREDRIHYYSRSTIFEEIYKKYERNLKKATIDLVYDQQLRDNFNGYILSIVTSRLPGTEPLYKMKVVYTVE